MVRETTLVSSSTFVVSFLIPTFFKMFSILEVPILTASWGVETKQTNGLGVSPFAYSPGKIKHLMEETNTFKLAGVSLSEGGASLLPPA